jgi:hypothetical protein
LYEKLKKSKQLSSISIVAGPAYSFFTGSSSYNKIHRPYLDDYKLSSIFPDLGLGYYFFKSDATVNLSYRFFKTHLTAFDVQQSVTRKSIALEAFKFFGDYHGFVPFTGLILSRELIHVKEVESGVTIINNSRNFWTPGIIVGWDVRPTKVDWWGVRTNIRYFPFLQVDMPANREIDFQQIEVNFLQLVLYPSRLRGTFFSGNQ